ncbi:MAG: TatD family hydrolase [Candidatus Melainabacteria bacterium]
MSYAALARMEATPPESPSPIVDTHAHLDYIRREQDRDPQEVMATAAREGVAFVVNPAVTPARFDEVLAIAESVPNVYAAMAIHPTDVTETVDYPDWEARIRDLLRHPKVVAIGETGLDYYWSTEHTALQQDCLRRFLALGEESGKPVILHDRDAHEDLEAIVGEFSTPANRGLQQVRGIMHCFSGDADFANRMTDHGFYISFAGNLTFKNAANLHEAARRIPLDRLLVETDAPFLSPMPFRGKPNEPARVRYVVEKIAELKGLSYAEVAEATTRNARRVFGIAEAAKEPAC